MHGAFSSSDGADLEKAASFTLKERLSAQWVGEEGYELFQRH